MIKALTYHATILALMMLLASTTVTAQYSPPVPPTPIIVRETSITISYAEPQKTVVINVTKFDPEQVVRSLTISFIVPVREVTLVIYLLAEKPPEVPEPPNAPLLYFTIRAHTELLENVERVKIAFVIEKTIVMEKGVNIETITLHRFFEEVWQQLPTKKVYEDEVFLHFEADSPGLSHFVATGAIQPFPWWIVVIAVIAAIPVIVFIYIRIRRIRVKRITRHYGNGISLYVLGLCKNCRV